VLRLRGHAAAGCDKTNSPARSAPTRSPASTALQATSAAALTTTLDLSWRRVPKNIAAPRSASSHTGTLPLFTK